MSRLSPSMLLLLMAVVFAAGGGAAWYVMDSRADDHDDAGPHAPDDPHAEDAAGPADHVAIVLDEDQQAEFGIQIHEAVGGSLDLQLELTGELRINPDAVTHVVPRIAGVVREVRAGLGDPVQEGDLLAVFDSRDLALAKAAFLATCERQELAQVNLEREQKLFDKKISSELDYLAAAKAKAEADIEIHSAEQRLHALGLSQDRVEEVRAQHSGDPAEYDESHDRDLLRYEMRAPISGTIIEKHITRGENLDDQTTAFVVADLSTVWASLTVYQKDLAQVREGQSVVVSAGSEIPDAHAVISYLSPVIDEQTRSAAARVILPNGDGRWRPGLFVTGRAQVGQVAVDVLVPRAALQTLEGQTVVFLQDEDGFEPHPVTIGRSDSRHVEILSGLEVGERYVAAGAFTLKAEWNRESFSGDGHAH